MKGHVDQETRALLPIRIGKRNATPELEIYAWLDTAFNGTLVLPRKVAFELELPLESIAEAILANGELVELETYGCSIRWLGKGSGRFAFPGRSDLSPDGGGFTRAAVHRLAADGYGLATDGYDS